MKVEVEVGYRDISASKNIHSKVLIVNRSPKLCWCDLEAKAAKECGIVPPLYVVEIRYWLWFNNNQTSLLGEHKRSNFANSVLLVAKMCEKTSKNATLKRPISAIHEKTYNQKNN